MDSGLDDQMTTRVLLARLRRRLATLLSVALAFVIVAVGLTALQPRTYKAETRIALEPAGERNDLERILFGSSDIGTQVAILGSRPLVARLLKEQGLPADPLDVDTFIERDLNVRNPLQTQVIEVTVRRESAEQAAGLSQGLAETYLEFLGEDAFARVKEALADLDAQADRSRQQLRSVEQELAGGFAGAPISASLLEERDALYAQLRFTAARSAELRTTQAFARRGEVIEPAVVPRAPATPRPLLNVGVAAVLGLVFGICVALLRDLRLCPAAVE